MSESVKVGGIGKNPAIEKVHRLAGKGMKNIIVKKMEEHMLREYSDSFKKYVVPINLKKGDWKGIAHGNKQERYQLAKNYLPEWEDLLKYTEILEKARSENNRKMVSLLSKTPGNIYEP